MSALCLITILSLLPIMVIMIAAPQQPHPKCLIPTESFFFYLTFSTAVPQFNVFENHYLLLSTDDG